MYFTNSIMKMIDVCNKMHLMTTIENISSIINNAIIQQIICKDIETGIQSCSYVNKFVTDLKIVVERNDEVCGDTCIDIKNIDYLIDNISMYKQSLNKIRECLDNNDTSHAISYMKSLDTCADLITVNTIDIFNDLGLETEGVF